MVFLSASEFPTVHDRKQQVEQNHGGRKAALTQSIERLSAIGSLFDQIAALTEDIDQLVSGDRVIFDDKHA
jgi:hypothetical protein